jgi:transcriptional regulator with XRE-family HTH domain
LAGVGTHAGRSTGAVSVASSRRSPAPFGVLLRQERLAAGLTQAALAARAGVSVRGIQDLERGAARPRRDTQRRLIAALALPPARRAAFEAAGAPAPRGRPAAAPPPGPPPGPGGESDGARHNLPLQLTSFVGRERELGEVAALLGGGPTGPRLVTLTGAGGVGKTRLALQAAAGALPAYPDGVWLVELAPLADPARVPQAVAAALGVREEAGRPLLETLTDALRPRRLLLVLDNCEHLVEAAARLVDALLRGCPGLRVLATSRELLGIAGDVRGLALVRVRGLRAAAGLDQHEAAAGVAGAGSQHQVRRHPR